MQEILTTYEIARARFCSLEKMSKGHVSASAHATGAQGNVCGWF